MKIRMDTSIPTYSPDRSDLLPLALASGALAVIVLGALVWKGGFLGERGGFAAVMLSPDTYPPHAVQIANGKGIRPLAIEGQGTATLYDEERTEKHAYYLMSGPGANQSTLYRQDLANLSAGFEQMTSSETLKLELSMHEVGGVATYTIQADRGAPHVAVLDIASKSERDLGEGEHPIVLADGTTVLFERNGMLLTVDLGTGKEHEVLRVGNEAVYAVDTSASQFAVYDRTENLVRLYWIARVDGAIVTTPGSTQPVSGTPEELFYNNSTLFAAQADADTLTVYALDGSHKASAAAPGLSLKGYRLTPL